MTPTLKTPDGINLTCYLIPQSRTSLEDPDKVIGRRQRVELTEAAAEARATVIFFHGNAMHNFDCFEMAQLLFNMKCNVFLLSYRGYVRLGE